MQANNNKIVITSACSLVHLFRFRVECVAEEPAEASLNEDRRVLCEVRLVLNHLQPKVVLAAEGRTNCPVTVMLRILFASAATL